ncbi:MAG: hypothetical protein AABM32_04670 [Chloroflexota bacterium]
MGHDLQGPGADEAETLERLGVLTTLELGLLEACRRVKAEEEAAFQRSLDEYERTKRTRAAVLTVPQEAQG